MRFLELGENDEVSLTRDMVGHFPRYATLSHLWANLSEEVTFEDIRSGTARTKAGYGKVLSCGRHAQRDGLRYFWIDACCIDMSSSAEVTEAVNSLFRLFQQAERCYVHLSDVSGIGQWSRSPQSRWFSRRWTLQELIAPKSVQFFSNTWTYLGDKVTLVSELHEKTGIPATALLGEPLSSFSPGERMAWAADRRTSREEDMAYSLMGLFNVKMPIIYGEGEANAMRRLQDEIRRSGMDSSQTNSTGMRLLVAGSNPLRMETVPISDDLQYAILSHTWGGDEVSFDDMRIASVEQRTGYPKIKTCCDLAAKQGFDYLWVDTCCIDKSSSAELQEAICSMYGWYKNAKVCYVYLDDFDKKESKPLESCRWFSRGWTLQELIAPTFVEFYDQNWLEIGTKHSLCELVAEITSIDPIVLRGGDPTQRTVAERMSWAAFRKTTRVEDEAYCLMGLFSVFMPMLYGEGHRAFQRLQEEIIKQTEDDTIFSWQAFDTADRGIFARTPNEFAIVRKQNIVPRSCHTKGPPNSQAPPTLTSRGLMLTLPILPDEQDENCLMAWVSCSESYTDASSSELMVRCIRLKKIQSTPQLFVRTSADKLQSLDSFDPSCFKHRTVCVAPNIVLYSDSEVPLLAGEIIVHAPSNSSTLLPVPKDLVAGAFWLNLDDFGSLTYWDEAETHRLASLYYEAYQGFVVDVGLSEGRPWCSLLSREEAQIRNLLENSVDAAKAVSKSFLRHTDRAEKVLSNQTRIKAAIRVMRSRELYPRRFGLYVEIEEAAEVPAVPDLLQVKAHSHNLGQGNRLRTG